MNQIPLAAVPSQTLATTLGGQDVQIELRQNGGNMYLSLRTGEEYKLRSKVCRDRQDMFVGLEYRGFLGSLLFVDMLGVSDPAYTGLGTRFLLVFVPNG